MPEARLEDSGSGLTPVSEGWFVVNARDAEWWFTEGRGARCAFENEERRLRAWDFFHAPGWTEHAFVGAGDGPCVILMVGSRSGPGVHYPVSELAARYGASVAEETSDWRQAYATAEWFRRERPPSWDRLPWA